MDRVDNPRLNAPRWPASSGWTATARWRRAWIRSSANDSLRRRANTVVRLTFYTMGKSKGLSDVLAALPDEKQSVRTKTKVLASVWRRFRE